MNKANLLPNGLATVQIFSRFMNTVEYEHAITSHKDTATLPKWFTADDIRRKLINWKKLIDPLAINKLY